ncbi:MAG: adenine deaminase [Candidatus Hadarchaeum sp.]
MKRMFGGHFKVQRSLVNVAMGREKADLVISGGKIINVHSREIHKSDIAIKSGRIALVGDADHTVGRETKVIDAGGFYLAPGLIDTHIHIEASMLTPTQFARACLPRGVTAVLWEPLWTANVLGKRGVKFFLDEGNRTPLKLFATASSGVPPAPKVMITAATEFKMSDIRQLLKWEKIVGLGEVVFFAEVTKGDPKTLEKIRASLVEGKIVDGSAPEFKGKELNAYAAAGVQSDHEAITLDEAIERLRLGMRLVIREGSSMRNLSELIKIITQRGLDPRHCCFCVDDKDIREIFKEGLIDHMVRRSIKAGIDPVTAVQIATLNAAEYIGIDRDIGSIAPGRIADILFVDDLSKFSIKKVMVNGKIIARDGKMLIRLSQINYPKWILKTIRVARKITPADFAVRTRRRGKVKVRVIKVFADQIITDQIIETLLAQNGVIRPDPSKDILKIAMIERFGKTKPNIGKGFVKGFGFKEGAIATSVAPDVHHLIAVGNKDADMATAINRLIEIQGGIVVCRDKRVLGELPLPVGGIVSPEPYEKILSDLEKIHEAIREIGCKLPSPFMTLAFSGCPTLTRLKISDKGLIDTVNRKIVPVEVG